MHSQLTTSRMTALFVALLALLVCTGSPVLHVLTVHSTRSATYNDPFRYCAAVGTADRPDSRYVGPKVPLAIARGLQKAFGIPAAAPLEPFMRNTYWRCMDGKIYACNIGANLPCLEKADISRSPTAAMEEYCQANANADVIAAYVTGRATVYAWRCQNGKATIFRQLTQPDARGYLSSVWYRIDPVFES